ncbi:hypothetical protein K466DRAFT_581858 [Polyporus arcularius HHB13444]|uniref:Uncharacterized protein n=1 Tax=Polyporus arcularius HHB13444 TaxID=1314778 RepID=A0A5C3PVP1_9APHY|nr:hypothetical protein K466DRAFT_581858 [Polyporus arcularius HHB13444]
MPKSACTTVASQCLVCALARLPPRTQRPMLLLSLRHATSRRCRANVTSSKILTSPFSSELRLRGGFLGLPGET